MNDTPKPSCETCKFFSGQHNLGTKPQSGHAYYGSCLRHAPNPTFPQTVSCWWCGEYEQAQITNEMPQSDSPGRSYKSLPVKSIDILDAGIQAIKVDPVTNQKFVIIQGLKFTLYD